MITGEVFDGEVVRARLFSAAGEFVAEITIPCHGGKVSEIVRIPYQEPCAALFRDESAIFDLHPPVPRIGVIDYELVGKFSAGLFVYQA